jgi:hypothetical protein
MKMVQGTQHGHPGERLTGSGVAFESQIGGSVGRCSEFDGDFMPAKASVKERWKRIDRAFHRGETKEGKTLLRGPETR